MRMTHTLAANCHINNPARFLRRSSRSHLRNLLSASAFCRRVEQQKETPHLLTWPVVNGLWVHARLLFLTNYREKKRNRQETIIWMLSVWLRCPGGPCCLYPTAKKRSDRLVLLPNVGKMFFVSLEGRSAELRVRGVAEQTNAIMQLYTHMLSLHCPPPHLKCYIQVISIKADLCGGSCNNTAALCFPRPDWQ